MCLARMPTESRMTAFYTSTPEHWLVRKMPAGRAEQKSRPVESTGDSWNRHLPRQGLFSRFKSTAKLKMAGLAAQRFHSSMGVGKSARQGHPRDVRRRTREIAEVMPAERRWAN